MRISFFGLIILQLSFLPSISQEQFVPGAIIQLAGDTISGEIQQGDWYNTPEMIQFRAYGGSIEELGPGDIEAFSVEGRYFLSVTTEIEVSSRKIEELEFSSKLNLEEVTVFIERETEGPYSLYSYRRDNYDHFFLKYGEKVQPLYFKPHKLTKEDGSDYLAENNRFRMQLDFLLGDDCDISFERLRYISKDLKKALHKYYNCIGFAFEDSNTRRPSYSAGVLAGLAYSSLSHRISPPGSGSSSSALAATNFKEGLHRTFFPVIGIFLDAQLGERTTSIRMEFSHLKVSTDANYETMTPFRRVRSEMQYETSISQMAVLFVAKPPKLKNIQLGFGPTLSLNHSNRVFEERETEELLSNTISQNSYLDYESFFAVPVNPRTNMAESLRVYRPLSFGVHASVAIGIKSYLFSLKINRSEDIVNLTNINLNRTDLTLAIHKDLWSNKTN